MSEIILDQETHSYTVDGLKRPSVTQILQDCGVSITQYFDEQSRIRGQYVHQACEFYDYGDLDLEALDSGLSGYVQAYISFIRDSGFKPELIEFKVFNKFHSYCGTLDRVGVLNGSAILLDIKSGSVPEWAGLQTAAYVAALKAMGNKEIRFQIPPRLKRFSLNLLANGKYKLTEYKNIEDENDFFAACRVYHWKRQINKRG